MGVCVREQKALTAGDVCMFEVLEAAEMRVEEEKRGAGQRSVERTTTGGVETAASE